MAYAGIQQSKITDKPGQALQRYQSIYGGPTQTPKATQAPTVSTAKASVTAPKTSTSTKSAKQSKAEQDYQKSVEKAIKESYASGTEFLAGQEARLREMQPQYEQRITETFQAQVPEIEALGETQRASIAAQEEATKAQRESALAGARRQFEEGQIRTQQLFGGVRGSSAGQAQSEILGRELLRQTGETGRTTATSLQSLAQASRDIENQVANQKRQIELQKQDAILKARDQFRNQLDTISQQRFQLGQERSNKQLQALQDFNARRRQLEDFYTQQEAALEAYKEQQRIGLDTYAQQLAIAQRYQPAGVSVPDLASFGYDNQARLGAINKILTLSDTDLRKAGYRRDVMPVGNTQQQVIVGADGTVYDVYTGSRIR